MRCKFADIYGNYVDSRINKTDGCCLAVLMENYFIILRVYMEERKIIWGAIEYCASVCGCVSEVCV